MEQLQKNSRALPHINVKLEKKKLTSVYELIKKCILKNVRTDQTYSKQCYRTLNKRITKI